MCDYVVATSVQSVLPTYACDPVTYVPLTDVCDWPGISCSSSSSSSNNNNNSVSLITRFENRQFGQFCVLYVCVFDYFLVFRLMF